MDLLVHPTGPRLRDRISHGEVAMETVSQKLASFTICALVACCLQTAGGSNASRDINEVMKIVSIFSIFVFSCP